VHNGILLCFHHHDLIHRTGIEIKPVAHGFVFIDRHDREITDDVAHA
jgi:hypothetical protein